MNWLDTMDQVVVVPDHQGFSKDIQEILDGLDALSKRVGGQDLAIVRRMERSALKLMESVNLRRRPRNG